MSFKVGDYVIADHAVFDDWQGVTWEVEGFGINLFREALVHVVDIATMNTVSPRRTCFYPHELSWEDGSRP